MPLAPCSVCGVFLVNLTSDLVNAMIISYGNKRNHF